MSERCGSLHPDLGVACEIEKDDPAHAMHWAPQVGGEALAWTNEEYRPTFRVPRSMQTPGPTPEQMKAWADKARAGARHDDPVTSKSAADIADVRAGRAVWHAVRLAHESEEGMTHLHLGLELKAASMVLTDSLGRRRARTASDLGLLVLTGRMAENITGADGRLWVPSELGLLWLQTANPDDLKPDRNLP